MIGWEKGPPSPTPAMGTTKTKLGSVSKEDTDMALAVCILVDPFKNWEMTRTKQHLLASQEIGDSGNLGFTLLAGLSSGR